MLSFIKVSLILFLGYLVSGQYTPAKPASAQAVAPYGASPVIQDISLDWSSHVRLAPGSDKEPGF